MQATELVKRILFTFALVATVASSRAQAATACSIGASEGSEEASLLKCYQREFSEKMKSNDQRSVDITSRAKDLARGASEVDARKQVVAYLDLLRKVNKTISSSRRIAGTTCVRMAAKFSSPTTSAVAAVNCRSGHEVELDKDLRRLELQLEVLSLQQF